MFHLSVCWSSCVYSFAEVLINVQKSYDIGRTTNQQNLAYHAWGVIPVKCQKSNYTLYTDYVAFACHVLLKMQLFFFPVTYESSDSCIIYM